MKKANSIIKDDSNLRKSRFGCNFHHSLINFKKHHNSFLEHMGYSLEHMSQLVVEKNY